MKNLCLILFCLLGHSLFSQLVTIHISGLRNNEGTVRIQFFDNKENFDKEKPLFTKTAAKAKVNNGQLTISYNDIKPGTYGIAILDDENNNQKMDYGIVLPKEGFGFSDYYHSSMSRPDFQKFSFKLGTEAKVILIKVRYM